MKLGPARLKRLAYLDGEINKCVPNYLLLVGSSSGQVHCEKYYGGTSSLQIEELAEDFLYQFAKEQHEKWPNYYPDPDRPLAAASDGALKEELAERNKKRTTMPETDDIEVPQHEKRAEALRHIHTLSDEEIVDQLAKRMDGLVVLAARHAVSTPVTAEGPVDLRWCLNVSEAQAKGMAQSFLDSYRGSSGKEGGQ